MLGVMYRLLFLLLWLIAVDDVCTEVRCFPLAVGKSEDLTDTSP